MIASVGWANEVTFTAGTDKGETLVVKDGITVNMSTMNRDDNYRCYANSNMTVYGKEGITVTKIEITCTGSGTNDYGPGKFSLKEGSPGTYSYSEKLGKWEGSATIDNKIYLTAATQVRMTKIVVTYEVVIPAYTITAQSNNTNYGTVSLNGSVITGSPNSGYRYADPAYTVSPENSATVAQDGNEFTVTPSANTTVTINFEAIPTYTVTLGDDNSTLTEATGNAGVTLPTREALNGYDFAGWSVTNVSEETTTAPTIIPAGDYAPTADITLYPVYTKTVGGGGTTNKTASVTISEYATANSWANSTQYEKVVINGDVTATASNTTGSNTGKYYTNGNDWRFYQTENGKVTITATNGTLSSVTFTFSVGNTGTLNYNSSAITSGTAVNVSGTSAEFTVGNSGTATNGQVKITAISVNYAITGAGTTYYWSAPVAAAVETPAIVVAENPFLFSTTATITCETEGATIKYSFDGENWSDYSSALTINETKTIYAKAIKGENESEVAQVTATKNLATPIVTVSGDLTLDLDGKTNVNAGTLTAAVTYNDAAIDGATVTWSSSNTDVATIDASTGAVTLLTTGAVTFTATYAGNSDYAEATATKAVTVIDNNAPGSAGNPYTVAQAIAYINTLDNSTSANEVYVSGIISQVDSYSSQYNSITYWISDDGSTANQMEVYSGKGLNGANFTAVTDLEVGDVVTVKGKVKKYNDTPEFDKNNHLVSFTRPEKPKHTAIFSVNGQILTVTVTEGAAITFPEDPDDINGKTFVGWITNTIDGTTNTAPAFVTSASMGNSDVTYYAVFAIADATGEPVETKTQTLQYDTWTYSGTTIDKSSYRLFGNGSYIESEAFDLSKLSKVIVYGGTFGGANYNSLTIGDGTNIWMSVTVSGSSQTGINTYSGGTSLTGTNKLRITATAGDGKSNGLRISKVEIFTNEPSIVYTGYCTTVESEEPVVEPSTPVEITEGFYTIKNLGNEKFVNVAGRKTVTFVDETATSPGTVIKVESNENGQVQVLRSQGVDLPGYAERAMKYVPKIVQLVAEKLGAEGEGNLLGKDGLDAIMKKFNESFDYHLYTEQGEQGVRIYGKTPSMQPVVDFYNDNKANVDAKLPMLEDFINSAIRKVLDKTSGSGASILTEFSLHEIWEKMGKTLAEPTDDASELLFLQQVLSNKTNVWDFAYQTAMKYWKPLISHEKVQQNLSELGDLAQYVEKIEYIRPDVKYYIVQKDGKIDFISQDNTLLKEASSEWELAARETFTVNFDEQNVQKEKYYTTLYTDFAYTLPEGVKAMTVAKVAELNGKSIAITETIKGAVPAQTPVLLESATPGDVELTLEVTDGTAIVNLLKGNDWLVNELEITTPQVDKLFGIVHDLLVYENMESLYDRYVKEYEYLKKRNAGTVNNKYFFALSGDDIAEASMNICQFTKDEQGLAFSHNLEQSAANKAFLPGDKDPVYLSFVGDVDRDGDVDKDDLSALIKIILGTDTEEDNYDYDAANVNEDENENPDIADVTALVNILK